MNVSDDFFGELDELSRDVPQNPLHDGAGTVEVGLQKLASLVEDLNRDLSTSTLLERAMSAAMELTGAERGFLVLVSEVGEWTFRVARNMETGEIRDAEHAASHTIIQKVIEGRRPILVNDVLGAPDITKHQTIARMQVRSIMGAPLIAKGKLLGAAYVDTSRLAGVFDETSLVLFETFVQLAAVAIENARLIEAEQEASNRYRELQEYLNTVLSSQPHGIIILDSAVRIEYVSPQAVAVMPPGSLVLGQPFADCMASEAGTMVSLLSDLQDFIENGTSHHASAVLGTRTLAYSFFHVPPGRRKAERVGIILEDITVRKELERKLIESERWSTINQLAGGIAHEINNSLQPVKGRVELLTMRLKATGLPLDNGIDKDLETILALSDRVERIARNLRRLSKPAKPEFRLIDMRQLVQFTVDMMESTTGSLRGFARDDRSAPFWICLDLENDLPPVRGEQQGIENALINLILNACHAVREKGGGGLTISARACDGGVRMAVEDSGTGILPSVMPRVFEPYFTTRPESGGTGLGMSIVQNVAEIHGAQLDLRSDWGEGTSVAIIFPYAEEVVKKA